MPNRGITREGQRPRMSPKPPPTIDHPIPDTLLILGTDAAGKDYVAQFIVRQWQQAGYQVEKRAGWFSAPATDAQSSSERKGRLKRLREQMFLSGFPFTRALIPLLLPALIAWDLRRFRWPGHPLLIASHTALRLLAFYLGHRPALATDLRLSPALERALRAIVPATRAAVLVLDIDDAVRRRRIAQRIQSGTVDPFDRYMLRDGRRSERIERCLVELATTYLGAIKIENNDLDDAALAREIARALARFRSG